LPVAGDDAKAKAVVLQLVDELGFDAVAAGGLDDSWRKVHSVELIAKVRRVAVRGLPARLPARQKKLPSRGGWFRPSCELKTCTPATPSAWASGHFSAQTARRGSSARCSGNAYG
jgi:hypothetical protein